MGELVGIHHVTAFAGDPQANLEFYTGFLGLRLVKKTVNFDDPYTYHFYYGDQVGHPGTIMTFFPWVHGGVKGQSGTGQQTATSFSIPDGALNSWEARLAHNRIDFEGPFTRFDEEVLAFQDPDGLWLELVESAVDRREGRADAEIPEACQIRGLHSVTLSVRDAEATAELLTRILGFKETRQSDNRSRYETGVRGPGRFVDILLEPAVPLGRIGVGSVHHVAWRVPDDKTQGRLKDTLAGLGYNVSPVMDRQYFRSIYFREPGRVLFEIATDPPGFIVDETVEELGAGLKLPPWLESRRASIEANLPPIRP